MFTQCWMPRSALQIWATAITTIMKLKSLYWPLPILYPHCVLQAFPPAHLRHFMLQLQQAANSFPNALTLPYLWVFVLALRLTKDILPPSLTCLVNSYPPIPSIFWNQIHVLLPSKSLPFSSLRMRFTFSSVQSLHLVNISIVALITWYEIFCISLVTFPLSNPRLCFYFCIQYLPQCMAHMSPSTIFAEWKKHGRRQNSEVAEPGIKTRTSYS